MPGMFSLCLPPVLCGLVLSASSPPATSVRLSVPVDIPGREVRVSVSALRSSHNQSPSKESAYTHRTAAGRREQRTSLTVGPAGDGASGVRSGGQRGDTEKAQRKEAQGPCGWPECTCE